MSHKQHIFPSAAYSPQVAGVYGVLNKSNLRIYVGSSGNLYDRFRSHGWALNTGKRGNSKIQNEFTNHPEHFEFVVLEEVYDADTLKDREQFWMDFYQSYSDCGYNNALSSKSAKGFKRPAEATARMMETRREKKVYWKPVIQMTLDGEEVARFEKIKDAAQHLGKSHTHICSVLSGRKQSAYGYKWQYA